MNIKLTIGALMSWVSLTVSAYDIKAGEVYYDIISSTEVAVTSGDNAYSRYVNVPDEVMSDGITYQVTAIADRAFNACTDVTGVRLPKHIRTIGNAAFASCSKLAYISLPDSLRSLGDAAFCGCSSLVSVKLPAELKTLGNEVFMRCSKLESFGVDTDNLFFSVADGVLFNKAKTALLVYPNARSNTYIIPSSVETIGPSAFAFCPKLTEILIPGTVKTISEAAFFGCPRLSKVTFSAGLETIGMWSFAECKALKQVSLPASVSNVSDEAFSFCPQLLNIFTEGNAHYVSDNGVLLDAARSEIVAMPSARSGAYSVPSTVTTLDNHAFYGADRLTSITLPASITTFSGNPFVMCDSLQEILVDASNDYFTSAKGVLLNKEQTELLFYPNAKAGAYNVPKGVSRLSASAFSRSFALEELNIPSSVTSIDDWAFMGCESLQSINLPASTAIGVHSLVDCRQLRQIVASGQPTGVRGFAEEVYTEATLFVPQGLQATYKATEGWSRFSDIKPYGLLVPAVSISRGLQQSIPINIDASLPITAMQLQLALPEGMQWSINGDGAPLAFLDGAVSATHHLTCTASDDGKANVLIMSDDNSQIVNSAEEPLFHMFVDVKPAMAVASQPITLSNIVLTYAGTNGYAEAQQQQLRADINVGMLLGDVNRDSRINVTDVVEIANYLQDHATSTFHEDEADVNENNEISVSDAVETIGLIQQQAFMNAVVPEWISSNQTADRIYGNEVKANPGDFFFIRLNLDNSLQNYTAHQFEIVMPEGVELMESSDGEFIYQPSQRYGDQNQRFSIKEIENITGQGGRTYSVVSASMDLEPISLSEGQLLTLSAISSSKMAKENFEIQLRNIVFAGTDATEYSLADAVVNLNLSGKTGICVNSVNAEDTTQDIFNLQGVCVRTAAQTLKGLPAGIYIVGGKKIVVK